MTRRALVITLAVIAAAAVGFLAVAPSLVEDRNARVADQVVHHAGITSGMTPGPTEGTK